jgi:hypothetical protein
MDAETMETGGPCKNRRALALRVLATAGVGAVVLMLLVAFVLLVTLVTLVTLCSDHGLLIPPIPW